MQITNYASLASLISLLASGFMGPAKTKLNILQLKFKTRSDSRVEKS